MSSLDVAPSNSRKPVAEEDLVDYEEEEDTVVLPTKQEGTKKYAFTSLNPR